MENKQLNYYRFNGKILLSAGTIENPGATEITKLQYDETKPHTLYNGFGLTVTRYWRGEIIGFEYEVRRGDKFYNTSVQPTVLQFGHLNNSLEEYYGMKLEKVMVDNRFTEYTVIEEGS